MCSIFTTHVYKPAVRFGLRLSCIQRWSTFQKRIFTGQLHNTLLIADLYTYVVIKWRKIQFSSTHVCSPDSFYIWLGTHSKVFHFREKYKRKRKSRMSRAAKWTIRSANRLNTEWKQSTMISGKKKWALNHSRKLSVSLNTHLSIRLMIHCPTQSARFYTWLLKVI